MDWQESGRLTVRRVADVAVSDALLYTVQTLDRGAGESHSLTKRWQCLTLCAADVRFGEVAWSDTVHCRRWVWRGGIV